MERNVHSQLLEEMNRGAFKKPITRRSKDASEGVLVIRGRGCKRSGEFCARKGIKTPTDYQLRRFHDITDSKMYVEGHLDGRSLIKSSRKVTIETFNRRLHESCSEEVPDSSSSSITITIGVPAIYQDMATLQDLIDSVEKQTVLPDEILIYMTGVGSKKVSVEFCSTDIPIRIFTEPEKKKCLDTLGNVLWRKRRLSL